jgi:hypothetical protein
MKTFEANSIRTGKTDGEMVGMNILSKPQYQDRRENRIPSLQSISFDQSKREAAPGR